MGKKLEGLSVKESDTYRELTRKRNNHRSYGYITQAEVTKLSSLSIRTRRAQEKRRKQKGSASSSHRPAPSVQTGTFGDSNYQNMVINDINVKPPIGPKLYGEC